MPTSSTRFCDESNGGYQNSIGNTFSATGSFATGSFIGGDSNLIDTDMPAQLPSCYNLIGIGSSNYITVSSYGFIGGGENNCIDATPVPTPPTFYGTIGGGKNNRICAGAQYASVLGGQDNCVSSDHSAVLGGFNNTVTGKCSAVIGGCGNSVSHNFSAAFGCNVASAFDCAFHANQIVTATPQLYGIPGAGLLQYFPVTPALIAAGLPSGSCIVLI